ncbi:hypothetical protein [Clostridium kluyveri]|uniref:Uncharacterized protein n=1 Tax=Clostridium kluyveri TaxID=1534 RepID=A0A1L5FC37_CLOKL|nr:hypothetical protein [Clostridium kluyveri]APM40578.1 hypothetical protein BS101_18550 [Clostridium kluyveri]
MPRTYSLSEAIQMLEKNRKLEFKQYTDVDGVVFLKLNDRGWLVSRNAHGDEIIIDIEGKWELVQKPVTFMEALESGKWVKVEHEIIQPERFLSDYGDTTYWNSIDRLLYILSNSLGAAELREVILEGKWYIKED